MFCNQHHVHVSYTYVSCSMLVSTTSATLVSTVYAPGRQYLSNNAGIPRVVVYAFFPQVVGQQWRSSLATCGVGCCYLCCYGYLCTDLLTHRCDQVYPDLAPIKPGARFRTGRICCFWIYISWYPTTSVCRASPVCWRCIHCQYDEPNV